MSQEKVELVDVEVLDDVEALIEFEDNKSR